MRTGLPGLAALLLALTPCGAVAHVPGEARYLGNEGVLVSMGETKILFDAFYAESFDGRYLLVPRPMETAMMAGDKPFDGVDAIFVSHIHPDHFNSRKTIAYLRAHPAVRLYTGTDVLGAIRAADVAANDPLLQRISAIHVQPGQPMARLSLGGIEVEAFPIPHSGGQPGPHLAYRVTLGPNATVMHLGDADSSGKHFLPYQGDLDSKTTQLAFAPAWMLTSQSGRQVLEQQIKAEKVIGIHVQADARNDPSKARKEAGGDLFIEPGETRPLLSNPR